MLLALLASRSWYRVADGWPAAAIEEVWENG